MTVTIFIWSLLELGGSIWVAWTKHICWKVILGNCCSIWQLFGLEEDPPFERWSKVFIERLVGRQWWTDIHSTWQLASRWPSTLEIWPYDFNDPAIKPTSKLFTITSDGHCNYQIWRSSSRLRKDVWCAFGWWEQRGMAPST